MAMGYIAFTFGHALLSQIRSSRSYLLLQESFAPFTVWPGKWGQECALFVNGACLFVRDVLKGEKCETQISSAAPGMPSLIAA